MLLALWPGLRRQGNLERGLRRLGFRKGRLQALLSVFLAVFLADRLRKETTSSPLTLRSGWSAPPPRDGFCDDGAYNDWQEQTMKPF